MQAVEINAGTWYLRALRADERITDVPALTALGVSEPEQYVRQAADGWENESEFVWAICIPTTGELIALIGVQVVGSAAQLWGQAADGYDEALEAARGPVTRFAQGALGLSIDEA